MSFLDDGGRFQSAERVATGSRERCVDCGSRLDGPHARFQGSLDRKWFDLRKCLECSGIEHKSRSWLLSADEVRAIWAKLTVPSLFDVMEKAK